MTLDQFLNPPGSPNTEEFGARCDPPLSGATISRIRHGIQNIRVSTMRSVIIASDAIDTVDGLIGRVLS